jgi:hypothetical protein
VPFAEWSDPSARASWKQTPEFAERFKVRAAICENAKDADYDAVVTIWLRAHQPDSFQADGVPVTL